MNTLELRHVISEHLSHIEDVSFLNALKYIIESKVSEGVYSLSEAQKKRIELAKHQLNEGQTVSHEALQKEIDQWLNSK